MLWKAPLNKNALLLWLSLLCSYLFIFILSVFIVNISEFVILSIRFRIRVFHFEN